MIQAQQAAQIGGVQGEVSGMQGGNGNIQGGAPVGQPVPAGIPMQEQIMQ